MRWKHCASGSVDEGETEKLAVTVLFKVDERRLPEFMIRSRC